MQKQSFFSHFLAPLTGADQLALEKARLEAFLNAFPGEYCGFHEDGSVVYSQGFCGLLGLKIVRRIEDVQSVLETGDSSALEGQYMRLEEEAKKFALKVRTADGKKTLRLRGAAGAAVGGADKFRILWAEDITEEDDTLNRLKRGKERSEKDLQTMKSVLDTLTMPVWIRDSAQDIVWTNLAYTAMLGLEGNRTEDDVQPEITLPPKSQSRSPKDMARDALKEGKPQNTKAHIIVQGKRRWMSIYEMPLPGTHQTIGYAQDLTSEEELKNEQGRHAAANKALLEQLRSAIAIFSADQSIEFFNSAFVSQWGLEEQWLNNRPKLGDILEKLRENRHLPEQADFRKYKQGWLDMFTRLIDPHDEMMYLPDGSAVRLLVIPHPMGGLMMTFEDVTSRLELESSYNTLIAVQKETLDNLAEGVVVYGGDGRVKLWNPAFATLWRLHPEDLEGGPHITKIVEKTARFFELDNWEGAKKSFISQGLERREQAGRMHRSDDIHLRYATMPLPDGGVMVSYYDITDSARVEMALRDKNAALEAADQLKADFLANVSYQLRTPLNAIMGFSEILDHQFFGPLNDKQKEYTNGIQEAGDRLINLIDDILDLSTIEAGYLELKKTEVDVAELLHTLYDLTSEWARKHNLQVRLNCPESIGGIEADPQRLKQAILNLIRNAINFTKEGGIIDISAQKVGDSVEISVQDNGIGIPQADLDKIFRPFERVTSSRSTNAQPGAGLGLTLVKNIIELHGGQIKLSSEEGQGTKATITL